MKKSPRRRLGARPRIEPEVVRKLFDDSGLSIANFGALAGASVRRMPNGGYSCSTVDYWLSGKRRMSAETYDLLVIRLWLLKHRYATFEELVRQPLKDLVVRTIKQSIVNQTGARQ